MHTKSMHIFLCLSFLICLPIKAADLVHQIFSESDIVTEKILKTDGKISNYAIAKET